MISPTTQIWSSIRRLDFCTEDTFFVDTPTFEGVCVICKRTATIEVGWVGIRCSVCRKVFDSENGLPGIVLQRRELMKMTRRQIAEATGYKPSSVKRFELVRCTRPYAAATERLILSFEL